MVAPSNYKDHHPPRPSTLHLSKFHPHPPPPPPQFRGFRGKLSSWGLIFSRLMRESVFFFFFSYAPEKERQRKQRERERERVWAPTAYNSPCGGCSIHVSGIVLYQCVCVCVCVCEGRRTIGKHQGRARRERGRMGRRVLRSPPPFFQTSTIQSEDGEREREREREDVHSESAEFKNVPSVHPSVRLRPPPTSPPGCSFSGCGCVIV